jgi:hypothetical protein
MDLWKIHSAGFVNKRSALIIECQDQLLYSIGIGMRWLGA